MDFDSCRGSAKMSSLTGQQKCHIHAMENVTLTSKEQARLQVLNSLLAEHMTLDQAAMLMGVTTRHTRRMLAAYREEGAAAVAHGHWGRQPPNATPDAVVAMWCTWLAPGTKGPTTPISASC